MSISNNGPTGFNPNFTFGNSTHTHNDTSTQPINISGASRHDSVSQNPRMRRESIAHSQGMGGISWGSVTIGSWLKDEVMLFAQQHAQEKNSGTSFVNNANNSGSIQVQSQFNNGSHRKNSINNPASFMPIMDGSLPKGSGAGSGDGVGMASPNSSAYLADLEANYCKDYSCCGQLLPTLHDLLRHYEEMHIQQEPVVETPRAHPMNGNGMDAVSTNEVFLNPQDEVGGFGQEQGDQKLHLQTQQQQQQQQQRQQQQQQQQQQQEQQQHDETNSAPNDYEDDAQMQIDEFSFDQVPALTTSQSPVGLDDQFQFQDAQGGANALFGNGFPLVDDSHQDSSMGVSQADQQGVSLGFGSKPETLGSGAFFGSSSQANGKVQGDAKNGAGVKSQGGGKNGVGIGSGNDRFRHPLPQQQRQQQLATNQRSQQNQNGQQQRQQQPQQRFGMGGFGVANGADEDMEDVCIDDPARRLYVAERDEDRPFKCPVIGCDKNYKNQNGLKYHRLHGHQNQKLRANPDGTFSVIDPRSNTPYPAGADLDKDKPYRCEVCGKRYKNLNGLKYHRGHTTH